MWRVIVSAKVLVGLIAAATLYAPFDVFQFHRSFGDWRPGGHIALTGGLSTWDIAGYLRLSESGYEAGSASCAFYPLWPAAIHVAATVAAGRPVLGGMLLTNGLSLVGLWLLYRMLEHRCGPGTGRDPVILMLAFPGALFFSFPYSESLYLVVLMVFFWGLEMERWAWTAVAGFLLPLARPVGVFVLLPLAWYLYERRKWPGTCCAPSVLPQSISLWWERFLEALRRSPVPLSQRFQGTQGTRLNMPSAHRGAAYREGAAQQVAEPGRQCCRRSCAQSSLKPWLLLICPLAGYGTYLGLMYAWTGNALEGFDAQRGYPNSPSVGNVFRVKAYTTALLNARTLDGMVDSALDRVLFVLFLLSLPLIWRLNKTWFFYALPAGLVPALTSWFISYRRYILIVFPVFVVLAQLLAKTGNRFVFWYYVALLAVLQAWAVMQFVNFGWAG